MSQPATVDSSLDSQLEDIFASKPSAIADPFPVWQRLHDHGAAYRLTARVVVSGHPETKACFRNKALSSRAFIEGSYAEALMAKLTPEQRAAHLEVSAFESNYMSRSDGDSHTRLRTVARSTFTPRRVAEMEARIQAYTDDLLSQLACEEVVDLTGRFTYLLPLMVISDLLGIPEADRELIHTWSAKLGRNRGGDDGQAVVEARDAIRHFRTYLEEIISAKRTARSETDLLAALMEAEKAGLLSTDELIGMFVVLLFAGHETTTNLIGNGLLALLHRRDQWDILCRDPSEAVNAVDELMRYVSPAQWQLRVTVEPVLVGDFEIAQGETVVLLIAAANRDPRVFADPMQLDIRRGNASEHVGFGYGPHFCLGSSLAKMEGIAAFSTLARRFPQIELASSDLQWRGNAKLRGLTALPVHLGADRHGAGAAAREDSRGSH